MFFVISAAGTSRGSRLRTSPTSSQTHRFPNSRSPATTTARRALTLPPQHDPQRSNKMKTNTTDLATAAQEFFSAYDAHDVEGMIALCADGARGRYAPYGRESVVPIRGGIHLIWGAFPQSVPNFKVKVIEMIRAEENTIVVHAEVNRPIPIEAPVLANNGQIV